MRKQRFLKQQQLKKYKWYKLNQNNRNNDSNYQKSMHSRDSSIPSKYTPSKKSKGEPESTLNFPSVLNKNNVAAKNKQRKSFKQYSNNYLQSNNIVQESSPRILMSKLELQKQKIGTFAQNNQLSNSSKLKFLGRRTHSIDRNIEQNSREKQRQTVHYNQIQRSKNPQMKYSQVQTQRYRYNPKPISIHGQQNQAQMNRVYGGQGKILHQNSQDRIRYNFKYFNEPDRIINDIQIDNNFQPSNVHQRPSQVKLLEDDRVRHKQKESMSNKKIHEAERPYQQQNNSLQYQHKKDTQDYKNRDQISKIYQRMSLNESNQVHTDKVNANIYHTTNIKRNKYDQQTRQQNIDKSKKNKVVQFSDKVEIVRPVQLDRIQTFTSEKNISENSKTQINTDNSPNKMDFKKISNQSSFQQHNQQRNSNSIMNSKQSIEKKNRNPNNIVIRDYQNQDKQQQLNFNIHYKNQTYNNTIDSQTINRMDPTNDRFQDNILDNVSNIKLNNLPENIRMTKKVQSQTQTQPQPQIIVRQKAQNTYNSLTMYKQTSIQKTLKHAQTQTQAQTPKSSLILSLNPKSPQPFAQNYEKYLSNQALKHKNTNMQKLFEYYLVILDLFEKDVQKERDLIIRELEEKQKEFYRVKDRIYRMFADRYDQINDQQLKYLLQDYLPRKQKEEVTTNKYSLTRVKSDRLFNRQKEKDQINQQPLYIDIKNNAQNNNLVRTNTQRFSVGLRSQKSRQSSVYKKNFETLFRKIGQIKGQLDDVNANYRPVQTNFNLNLDKICKNSQEYSQQKQKVCSSNKIKDNQKSKQQNRKRNNKYQVHEPQQQQKNTRICLLQKLSMKQHVPKESSRYYAKYDVKRQESNQTQSKKWIKDSSKQIKQDRKNIETVQSPRTGNQKPYTTTLSKIQTQTVQANTQKQTNQQNPQNEKRSFKNLQGIYQRRLGQVKR